MADELVGRDEELTTMRAARMSHAPGLVIAAPAGMGRTSLLAAMVDEWRSRRVDVLLLRATAWMRSLRFAVLGPVLTADIDGPLTFDVVAAALRTRAAGREFVLAVDDIHLVDEASLRVLADFAGTEGTFIIATVDETFIGLDPFTAPGTLEVLRLGPISHAAVAALVSARIREPFDVATWWDRCRGNPTALLDELSSTDPDGAQRTVATAAMATSDLSGSTRRLLAVIALAEPFPVNAAIDLSDRASLDELTHAGIIAITDDGEGPVARLRHPGHGTRFRRSLGKLESRGARRAALLALRDSWPTLSAPGRLRLASLAMESGVALGDEELIEVARLAPLAGDPRLALRLAREASERLGRFEDHRLLADVAHEQGEVTDVDLAISGMQASATNDDQRAALAVALSQHLLWRGGDAAGAVRALENIDRDTQPEVAAVLARLLATIGRPGESIAAAASLLDHLSPRVRTQASLGTAHALRLIGRPAQAVGVLDAALEASGAVADPVLSVSRQVLCVVRTLALTEAGRWTEATERAVEALSYAQRYDEAPGRAIALLAYGVAVLEAGSPSTAIGALSDALELFERIRQPAGSRWALAARALAYGLSGDAASARTDLDHLRRVGPHSADLFPSLEPRAQAWVLVAAAEPEAARQLLDDAVDRFVQRGFVGAAWACALDLLSLDRPAAMLSLAPVHDEPLCDLRIAHAHAIAGRDLGKLDQLVGEYEVLGGHRWAAECAAALGHGAAQRGALDLARRAGHRLATITPKCQGLDIPAVSTVKALALSTREREIALLAARGLTSRAIGDRLGLSTRTIDNHLARCFEKMAVKNRSELAEMLAP
jgi:DNA-binding CsgD family transcriptional regulator